jgi:diaminopimelate decarboxylase
VNPRILETCHACTRASLVFDLAAIEATMRRVASVARAAGMTPLFACKSFPHPDVRVLAAELLDGFDVASIGELRDVPTSKILSIVDPSGGAIAHAPSRGRVIVGCETIEQVRAAPPNAEIAIRVSASITGRDPAVGAVLDGSGHRRSRFGLDDRAAIADLARAAGGRRVGLHVHHGPVTATRAERFIATARATLALLDREPAFVDLGGAWHGLPDLAEAFAEIRAEIPPSIEILVEPGRVYADAAGFATGRVTATRDLGDRLLATTELSRVCHLRWSQVELVARAPHPGHGRDVLLVGPTCYEEDVIGEYVVEPARVAERVVLRHVSGYALAWNTGFGGVPPADVVMVK